MRDNFMDRKQFADRFLAVRKFSEELCQPLETEDFVVQTIEDVSPPKWHLGHTSWFFEQIVLEQFETGFRKFHRDFYYVFNSYYQSLGDRVQRDLRGTLSRPTVEKVMDYRDNITARTARLIEQVSEEDWPTVHTLLELGINHEQQHQELFITDIKHILASNPLRPPYIKREHERGDLPDEMGWIEIPSGKVEIGYGGNNFAYDNESPRHTAYIKEFKLATRPVTNAEFMEFMKDDGYEDHRWWFADGWDIVQAEHWQAPLYWELVEGKWMVMTMHGFRPVDPAEPVSHISHHEAHAYARWAGKRLPTEQEWEIASLKQAIDDNRGAFAEDRLFHPAARPLAGGDGFDLMFGNLWEWTSSAYLPYPGYRQAKDALGEYNGKFMNNQIVLRGGSCATPHDHIRPTYRNFFHSDKRWQFTGLRLADDPQ
jgi:ergothioneine biosynthesis protein EgtB